MRKKLHVLVVRCVIGFVLGSGFTANVSATYFARAAAIQEVQLYGHMRVDSPDIVWINMPGTWGSTSCAADWAWFNGKENPAYVATALAARSMNASVTVVVDDSYAKLSGYCQIITLAF
jgi:hypothetical protein